MKCLKCKATNHHTALCREGRQDSATLLVNQKTSVLLQTATGNITDPSENKTTTVRILFDSCSQRTHVSNKIVEKLALKPISRQTVTVKTFGKENGQTLNVSEYEFCLKTLNNEMNVYVKALGVNSICDTISGQFVNLAKLQHPFLNQLKLADRGNFEGDIDLLIGADLYWSLVSGTVKKDDFSGLVAISSKLGWLVSGPIACDNRNGDITTNMTHVMKIECLENDDAILKNELKSYWDLDTVGIRDDEISVYEQFLEDVEFKNGRYEVRLPIKEGHPVIEDNYRLALNRLMRLRNRLTEKPEIMKEYNEVIRDQLENGIIEIVDENKDVDIGGVTYLPHREVVRQDKKSTKVCVVFDASAKGSNGVSLNSCLYKGPCLSPMLFDLFLKFRTHPIAMTADIEKAYLQVSVDEGDRDLMRFLWFEDVFDDSSKVVKLRYKSDFWRE